MGSLGSQTKNVNFPEAKLSFSEGDGTSVRSDVCPETYYSPSETYNFEKRVLFEDTPGQGNFARFPGRTLKSSAGPLRSDLSAWKAWNLRNAGFPKGKP